MRRVVWFMSGAAGAVAVLVASPDLYTRLREAVAGGPVDGEDDWADDDDTSDVPFAPEERAEPASAPTPPPADEEADALRSQIGESRERMRRKAVAATPETDAAGEDDTAETS